MILSRGSPIGMQLIMYERENNSLKYVLKLAKCEHNSQQSRFKRFIIIQKFINKNRKQKYPPFQIVTDNERFLEFIRLFSSHLPLRVIEWRLVAQESSEGKKKL